MRMLKFLLPFALTVSTPLYAEVNIMLLSTTIEYNKLEKNKKKCSDSQCRSAHDEALDRKKDQMNIYENPKTNIAFETWANKSYSQKNQKSFNERVEALRVIDKNCDKDLELVMNSKSQFTSDKVDKKFCDKAKEQLLSVRELQGLPKEAQGDKPAKKSAEGLSGCTLSFDQSEIQCPFGIYIRSKSVTDVSRTAKPAETMTESFKKKGSDQAR